MRALARLRPWFAALALLCAAVLLAALLLGAGLGRQAQLVQLVQPTPAGTADLFGGPAGPGTPIGSPQRLVIRDAGAFLEGEAPGGARYVSDTYLRERGIYPLQLKTVELIRNLVALGAALVGLLSAALWWRAGRTPAPLRVQRR